MKLLERFFKIFKKDKRKEFNNTYFFIDRLQLLRTIKTYFNNYKELETYLQLILQTNNVGDMVEVNNMFKISETTIKEVVCIDFFLNSNNVQDLLNRLVDYRTLLLEKLSNEKDSYILRMTRVAINVIDEILSYF